MGKIKFSARNMSLIITLAASIFSGSTSVFSAPVNNPMTMDLDANTYNLFNIGDIITTGPYVDVRAYSSFSAAVNAIGTAKKTLLISTQQDVVANQSVPANINIAFLQGGSLNISMGVTVTVNAPENITAGKRQEIFQGAGNIAFVQGGTVYPEWWGANNTPGTTDMTDEMQAACDAVIEAGGGIVELQGGDYLISAPVYLTRDTNEPALILRGAGTGRIGILSAQATRIINNGNSNALVFRSIGGIHIEHLTIMDNLSTASRTAGAAILGQRTSDTGTVLCKIDDVYTEGHVDGIRIVRGQGTLISHSIIDHPKRDGIRIETVPSGGAGTSITINNTFVHTPGNDGYSIAGHSYILIENAACDFAGRHAYNIYPSNGSNPVAVTLSACGSEGSVNDAFKINNGFGVQLIGCYATNSSQDGVDILGFGTIILGGKFTCSSGYGINVSGGNNTFIAAVALTANTTGNVRDATNKATMIGVQGYEGIKIPKYSDAYRPAAGVEGRIIYNDTWNCLQIDDGVQWNSADSAVRTATGVYDFSVNGGETGNVVLFSIPNQCSIVKAWYDVVSTPASTGNATIAFGVESNDPSGILASTAFNSSSFNAGFHDAVPDGTAASFTTKTTNKRNVVMTIGNAPLVAGKIRLWVEYVRSF